MNKVEYYNENTVNTLMIKIIKLL